MLTLADSDPDAVALGRAIRSGDVESLDRLLGQRPGLAAAMIRDREGGSRTPLHIATDWPGNFPNGPATIAALVRAGADPDARFDGPSHAETPLHWAASSDDVEAVDALLDAGADIEAPGASIAGGGPLDDAVGYGQWRAARRLVERGARTTLWHAGALGLVDRVQEHLAGTPPPALDQVTEAFWQACHGGQRRTAELLLDRGADLNWVASWDRRTPLDIAGESGAVDLVEWLLGRGARSAAELG